MHLVAKGQSYDSLHKGFMFSEELNVFISILYTLETVVGREPVGKIWFSKVNIPLDVFILIKLWNRTAMAFS